VKEDVILGVSSLCVERAGRPVIDNLSFDLRRGEALVILGPNGAGKTTLLESIAGLLPTVSGQVSIDNTEIRHLPAHNRAQQGIRLVGQGRRVVPELTVAENLDLAAAGTGQAEPAGDTLDLFPRLKQRWNLAAGQLSGGEQQMLALAMGLYADPKVLILDEPSFGLAPIVVDALFEALRALRARGLSLLLAEQHVSRALALADRVLVLRSGRIVYESRVTRGRQRRILQEVIEGYMGQSGGEMAPPSRGNVEELVRLTLTVDQKRKLQLAAKDRGVTPSELVSTAVQGWITERSEQDA
jgi:branched-chain amino acid transport system ATP-binding protein